MRSSSTRAGTDPTDADSDPTDSGDAPTRAGTQTRAGPQEQAGTQPQVRSADPALNESQRRSGGHRPGESQRPSEGRAGHQARSRTGSGAGDQGLRSTPVSRRDVLLEVAGELMITSGYARTSLRDVADAAGIQAGSIYHHFASKEMLAVELVTAFRADLESVVEGATDLTGSSVTGSSVTGSSLTGPGPTGPSAYPIEALHAFAQRVALVVDRHRAAVHLTVYDAPSSAGEALTRIVREQPVSLDAAWATLLNSAARQGRLHPDVDLALLGFVLREAVIGLGQLPGAHSLQALVGSLTDLLLDGLAPAADTPVTPPATPGTLDAPGDATAPAPPPPATAGDPAPPSSPAATAARRAVAEWAAPEPSTTRHRRTLILDSARLEFARRGYEATTVRDIAEAADLRASSMYRHFDSKNAMLQAIMGNFSQRLLSAYEEIIHAGDSAVETLDALLSLMSAATEHFQPEFVIIRAWWRTLDGSEEPDPILAENASRLRLLQTLIERGVTAGEFRPPRHPELTALALRDVMWIRLQDASPGSPASPEQRLHFLRRCLLRGAATPRGQQPRDDLATDAG